MNNNIDLIEELIADSMDRFSNYNNPANPYIEIRPVVDAIVLLLKKNIALCIKDGNNNLVSTYKIENLDLTEINATKFEFGNYKLLVAEIIDTAFEKLEADDTSKLVELLNRLKEKHHENLINSIKYNSDKNNSEIEFINYCVEEYSNQSEKDTIVEELRKIITSSIRIFENNRTIRIESIDIPNVFYVIRYASNKRDKFNYSAQILLSDNQKRNTDIFLNNNTIHKVSVDCLEDPLDKDSLSIADECFKYECVRFENYKADTSNYKSESDRTRHNIENLIYDKITKDEKIVFYVPIHLNGAAWLAIYRIVPRDSDIDYISFYRNKISIIASQIRNDAYTAFLNLIRTKIEAISNNDSLSLDNIIDSVNEYLKLLSTYFSFYIPLFPEKIIGEEDFYSYLKRLVGENFSFKFYMNIVWKNDIDYDNIPRPGFQKRLKGSLNEVYLKKSVEKEKIEKESFLSAITHGFKTEYNSGLLRLKNDLKHEIDKSSSIDEGIKGLMSVLDKAMEKHKKLTGVVSLIEKMQNGTDYTKAGLEEGLLNNSETSINIKDAITSFNTAQLSGNKIQESVLPMQHFQIKVGDIVYFSVELLQLLLNTIFENALMHGQKVDKKVDLTIKYEDNCWEFENRMNNKTAVIDIKKLTGNLQLYQLLFRNKPEGIFEIENGNYCFKLRFK